MKTYREAKAARSMLNELIKTGGVGKDQLTMLAGMSIALQWICNDGGMTLELLEWLMQGEIAAGQTMANVPNPLIEQLRRAREVK